MYNIQNSRRNGCLKKHLDCQFLNRILFVTFDFEIAKQFFSLLHLQFFFYNWNNLRLVKIGFNLFGICSYCFVMAIPQNPENTWNGGWTYMPISIVALSLINKHKICLKIIFNILLKTALKAEEVHIKHKKHKVPWDTLCICVLQTLKVCCAYRYVHFCNTFVRSVEQTTVCRYLCK